MWYGGTQGARLVSSGGHQQQQQVAPQPNHTDLQYDATQRNGDDDQLAAETTAQHHSPTSSTALQHIESFKSFVQKLHNISASNLSYVPKQWQGVRDGPFPASVAQLRIVAVQDETEYAGGVSNRLFIQLANTG